MYINKRTDHELGYTENRIVKCEKDQEVTRNVFLFFRINGNMNLSVHTRMRTETSLLEGLKY